MSVCTACNPFSRVFATILPKISIPIAFAQNGRIIFKRRPVPHPISNNDFSRRLPSKFNYSAASSQTLLEFRLISKLFISSPFVSFLSGPRRAYLRARLKFNVVYKLQTTLMVFPQFDEIAARAPVWPVIAERAKSTP